MDTLFEELKKFIIIKVDEDKDGYHDKNLIKGKKYLAVNHNSKGIVALQFPLVYESYRRASAGAYGDLKSNKEERGNSCLGYCYGHYWFDFYELDGKFTIENFYDILKQKYTFDMDYEKDIAFDTYDNFTTDDIHIFKSGYILCSTSIEIDSDNEYDDLTKFKKCYEISFDGYIYECYGTFSVYGDGNITYNELFEMDNFMIKIKRKDCDY
jgi:hypothetical protein